MHQAGGQAEGRERAGKDCDREGKRAKPREQQQRHYWVRFVHVEELCEFEGIVEFALKELCELILCTVSPQVLLRSVYGRFFEVEEEDAPLEAAAVLYIMKASLKVREEQKPLVRAKLPLNLLGLPLFTGVTSGDPQELALHVGTYCDAGPAVRFSYKPNNAESPFSVLLKTGFGVWGSPHGAALAVSAEINLSSTGTPSFSFRLKPKFGDFGLRKDTRSISVAFTSEDGKDGGAPSIAFEEKKSTDMAGDEKRQENSIRALSYDGFSSPNGSPTDISPPGKLVNGLSAGGGVFSVKEKIQSFSNGALEKTENLKSEGKPLDQYKDGSSDSGSIEDGFTPVYDVHHCQPRSVVNLDKPHEVSKGSRVDSWIGASTNGWNMSAHSALPLGDRAVAKVRWSMRFGSNAIQNAGEGFSITDIRLPTLNVDKFSIEATETSRRYQGKATFEATDITIPGFSYNGEDNQQMSRIAAMCVSMRYQLQLMHSENKVLKKTMEDLRSEIAAKKLPAKASELLLQEENALRSQLFDELSGRTDANTSAKLNGKSARGKLRDGIPVKDSLSKIESHDVLRSGGSKASGSTVTDFSSTVDPVSEELKKAIMNATGG